MFGVVILSAWCHLKRKKPMDLSEVLEIDDFIPVKYPAG